MLFSWSHSLVSWLRLSTYASQRFGVWPPWKTVLLVERMDLSVEQLLNWPWGKREPWPLWPVWLMHVTRRKCQVMACFLSPETVLKQECKQLYLNCFLFTVLQHVKYDNHSSTVHIIPSIERSLHQGEERGQNLMRYMNAGD